MENRKPSFSPDDSDVATWALPEGAIARLGRGSVGNMAFSPDGQYFAVGSWIGLWLYELPTLSPIALWDTVCGTISAVAFSADSRWIVTYTFVENFVGGRNR
jgi:WD40 repeat protein